MIDGWVASAVITWVCKVHNCKCVYADIHGRCKVTTCILKK